MADHRRPARNAAGVESPSGSEAEKPQPTDWSSWSNLWQVPTIVASVLVIILGLYVALQRAPTNDFDGALDQVDILIQQQEFQLAARQLNEIIEPNLDEALPHQQARFEATVADWIVLSQDAAGLDLAANNRRIIEHYIRAVDLGLALEPKRIERWAEALIALGDVESARRRLNDLEDLAGASGGAAEIRERRNRVLRRIVETSLENSAGSTAVVDEMLLGYRSDPMLSPADELWAIARQAELRIESGAAQEAIDLLLVDMRRFEPRLESNPELNYGELFALLARAYYDLGNYSYAQFHADQAMELIPESDVARGQAVVLLGRLSVAAGQWPEAFDAFDRVVRNFGSTASGAAGRLGRAEVFSILGDHERSIADYQALREALAATGPRGGVNGELAARSLSDRHDAALTMGRLDTALQYILLAETFFDAGGVPDDVLFRIASTSRQIADNVMRDAAQPAGPGHAHPATRYTANDHYRRAGDYYVRHARRLTGRPNQDEAWAESLWLAADSFDLGGWHDLAVTHFTEYVAGRSEADPRRIEAVFRLAQAHHAVQDFDAAVAAYERVIAEHPRSHVATQSLVPLARCLLALGRTPEAEQQLIQIVSGKRNLTPDAAEYRDALIELGALHYDAGEYPRAIEQMDEAARRYPEDSRIGEIRFRLADSHRRRSGQIEGELAAPVVTPQERQRLERLRVDHLKAAMDLFAAISETESRGKRGITEQMLRHAFLYRADCAFELGMYPQAIAFYDDYAGRYSQHHSSMTALIQIVNCYSNLGDMGRADTAHRRAIARLGELPEEAFKVPDALLDRPAWERWLKNMPVGETQTASAGG